METKPELVVPAGNLEKFTIALFYGADAVYIGGDHFNLRKRAHNFSKDELKIAVDFAKKNNKKTYFTLNSFLYERDITLLKKYLRSLSEIAFDAIIVADPGMLVLVRELLPERKIHLSTQANTLNQFSVHFWAQNGVSRIILARELTISEIASITKTVSIETELFIHGAVCLSYSGRCYLSKYMANRDANLGDCSQSCRWLYSLQEETRPGEYFPVFEEDSTSFILNTKDMCSIKQLPQLLSAGVSAFKIEGRMKSSYYVAITTMIYRQAIDSFFSSSKEKTSNISSEELEMLSHRPYNYHPYEDGSNDVSERISRHDARGIFLGLVTEVEKDNRVRVSVRNSLSVGENIDIISPQKIFSAKIINIYDQKNKPVVVAHPNQWVSVELSKKVSVNYILRRKKNKDQFSQGN
ncbi:U32 family peptidase [Chlamydiota bacterium]